MTHDGLPGWCAAYIGLPFRERGRTPDGLDCFGLLRLVLAEQYGIALPSYVGRYVLDASVTDRAVVERLFLEETTSGRWASITLDTARPGDVLELSLAGRLHVGLLVAPNRMLHVLPGRETCVERVRPHWAPRVLAVYRAEALSHV